MTALHAPAFRALPLTSIRPEGWLARQLRIQADGLSGHLCDFYPDIHDSQWFGGRADGWERAPYWLDGAIPLAVLTGDEALSAKVRAAVQYILRHQAEDGWLGPGGASPTDRAKVDMWSPILACKAIAQCDQMPPAAGQSPGPAMAAVQRFLKLLPSHLAHDPLSKWGQYRAFEALIPLFDLYEQTGDAQLLDIARRIVCQGFDWGTFFRDLPQAERTKATHWSFDGHVVNCAMMIKAGALLWRLTGRDDHRLQPAMTLQTLDRYHGQANGLFTGDECLAGRDPSQGTELCAVVELMYSLELLTAILGEPAFADRLELVTFNALPATFSPDMWSHQYLQQANQISATVRPKPLWTTNNAEANLFGLEPNYPCCTANLSQGWPKFAAHLWLATPQGGLAAVSYAPCTIRHRAGDANVELRVQTDYPFRPDIHITIRTDRPARFPLMLRIPAWAAGATIRIAKTEQPADPGSFVTIDRTWDGTTEIDLHLPMRPVGQRRFNNSLSITRGPLVYSLKIGEEWTILETDRPHRQPPHCDYEVRPTTPWNYALDASPETLDRDLTFTEHPVGDRPFSPDSAPIAATSKARRLPDWQDNAGDAAPPPHSPATSTSPLEQVTLIPYGCTNLRLTECPTTR